MRREGSPDEATLKDETLDGLEGNGEAKTVLGIVVEDVVSLIDIAQSGGRGDGHAGIIS